MPWAAMRFLLEAMRKQRRRLRLETLILLAVRCLLLACLGAAIARPILAGAGLFGTSSGRDVYVVIDNSIASALREGGEGGAGETALTWHVKKAKLILESLTASDRAGLVLLGGPADALVVPASSDSRAVSGLLDGLTPTDSAADLAGALDRIGSTVRSERAGVSAGAVRPVAIHVLSGFASGSADLTRPLPAALQGLDDVSIIATRPRDSVGAGNVQIVAIEPLRSVVLSGKGGAGAATGGAVGGEASQVRVMLRRTGASVGTSGVTTLRLAASSTGAMTASGTGAAVRWNAGQSEASVTVQLDSAPAHGEGRESVLIAEIDRDALANDNVRRRPIEVRDRLQVGIVAQRTFGSAGRADQLSSAEWFRLALRPGEASPIEVVDIEPSAVDAPVLALLDAVVLPAPDLLKEDAWGKIRRFADSGGLVVVSPPEGASVHLWADSFTKAMGLSWRVAREATAAPVEGPARLVEPAAGVVPGAGSDGGTIFVMLAQELQQLARPVTISKWLDVEAERGAATALLSMVNGKAWVLAGRVGATVSESGGGGGGGSQAEKAGEPGAAVRSTGRGLVVMLASAPVLSWTDLPARPLMVPLVQEVVRQGVGEAGATLSAVAGRGLGVPSGTAELRAADESAAAGTGAAGRIAVDANGSTAAVVRGAGVWRANDSAGRSRGVVVVNPDVDGAKLDAQAPDGVRAWLAGAMGQAGGEGSGGSGGSGGGGDALASVAWIEDVDAAIGSGGVAGGAGASPPGKSAWTLPLFIAALVLAFVEVFLARWFSHAKVDAPAGAGGIVSRVGPSLDDLMGGGNAGGAKGAAA